MKTHNFSGNYGEVKCKYFFDADNDGEGLDIYVDNIHIGEYYGINIPDDMDDEEYTVEFEKEIEDWLSTNY